VSWKSPPLYDWGLTSLQPSQLMALRQALEATDPRLSSREIEDLLWAVRRQHEDAEESRPVGWKAETAPIRDPQLRGVILKRMGADPPPVMSPDDPRLEGMGMESVAGEDQIAQMLAASPRERLQCLLDMLAFEERAHQARPFPKAP
jgi:hypothetical protein